ERNGSICNHLVGGSRSTRQKPCAHPTDQMVGADIVGRDDDHPAATSGVDPVLCQRYCLRSTRTGRVDLGVRTAGSDEFGKLGMSHGQDSKQKAPVEYVRFFLD